MKEHSQVWFVLLPLCLVCVDDTAWGDDGHPLPPEFRTHTAEDASFTNVPDAGNGTTLAITDNLNAVWMAYWDPGTSFFVESDQVAAGPRLYMSAGQYGVSKYLENPRSAIRIFSILSGSNRSSFA